MTVEAYHFHTCSDLSITFASKVERPTYDNAKDYTNGFFDGCFDATKDNSRREGR